MRSRSRRACSQNGVVAYGAFGSAYSRGTTWTAGVGWTGRYIMFVTDTATGNKITALVDITPGDVPTIDLDAICFGFDTCNYLAGGPANYRRHVPRHGADAHSRHAHVHRDHQRSGPHR